MSKLFSELAKGAWLIGTSYTIGDIVDHLGSSYVCIANSTGNEPPNATYWALLSRGIEWKGDWSAGTYLTQQAVAHSGSAWIANTTTTQEPSPSATEWDLMSSKGDQGTQGNQGNQGIQGIQGNPGIDGKSFNWEGSWVTSTLYHVNDVVSNNGSSYVCLIQHTSGTFGTDLAAGKWVLMAQKGTDGAGVGDVVGPATNTDSNIPQWDGPNSKVLKNGLGLDTDLSSVSANDDTVPSAKATKTALDLKVVANVAITGATKTKVTYDAKGLVTSGADATQDDIGDGTTNKQYSATDKTKLSGIETAADVTDAGNVGSSIHGATVKSPPVDADEVPIIDTEASNVLKKLTWTNIKAFLKTYFDTLYSAINSLVLLAAPGFDDTFSGISGVFTAGENLVSGDVVYMKSDGKFWKADASAIATSSAIAIVLSSISADATGIFIFNGLIRHDAWNWTVGGLIYLSETTGALTQTAPTTTDSVTQVMGIAPHADRMYFNPQLIQVEHV